MSSKKSKAADVLDKGGNLSVDKLLALARISESAERYPDMCDFMRRAVGKIAEDGGSDGQEGVLTVNQRNLLSVAYKNVVGAKRASWRSLNAEVDDNNSGALPKYKQLIEDELEKICLEVLALLKDKLIPMVVGQKTEEEVFYNKMCGDYYRYLAEFKSGQYASQAEEMYSSAMSAAEGLVETHPTRLGLALNFSVCYYEILNSPKKACALAKQAFDAAIQKLDSLDDASYKDSTLIMQLLRDNLTLWTSETDQDGMVEDTED